MWAAFVQEDGLRDRGEYLADTGRRVQRLARNRHRMSLFDVWMAILMRKDAVFPFEAFALYLSAKTDCHSRLYQSKRIALTSTKFAKRRGSDIRECLSLLSSNIAHRPRRGSKTGKSQKCLRAQKLWKSTVSAAKTSENQSPIRLLTFWQRFCSEIDSEEDVLFSQ